MAKVGHFAEGWQKKKVSEELRTQRNESVRKESRQASKVMEHLRAKVANKPVRPQSASAPKASPQVKSGKDVPRTDQRSRPETQDQAARQQNLASNRFSKVREDAQRLSKLQTKGPQDSPRATTRRAVTQKGRTIQTNLPKSEPQQPAARLANAANQAALKQVAQQNAAKYVLTTRKAPRQGVRARPTDRVPDQAGPKDASQAQKAAQLTAKVGQPAPIKDAGSRVARSKKNDEGKKSEKRKGSESTSKGAVYAAKSGAGRELNALMGGLGGGQDHDAHERAHEIASLTRTAPSEKLPETDPSFHVYNEVDSDNPGVELVKSKAQLFNKVVKERLIEIAQFAEEVDEFIEKGLTERVIGPLRHEIKVAEFLRSVYGGLIG